MKTTWIQIDGKLVRKDQYRPGPGKDHATILPDIAPFVSPITGEVISSRPQRDAHMRQHGVTHMDDYSPEFLAKRRKETHLEATQQTPAAKRDRIEVIKAAMEKHRGR